MLENTLVMEEIWRNKKAGRRAAVATVVRVFGSAYRKEGAKMLVDESGKVTGTISGGCLEADVAESAKKVIESGIPILKMYALDEDVVWGLGLGCPGTIEVYIELVSDEQCNQQRKGTIKMSHHRAFDAWLECIKKEKEGALATVLQTKGSRQAGRLFIPKKGHPIGTLGDSVVDSQVCHMVDRKLSESNPKPETIVFKGAQKEEVSVLIDVSIPPAALMIFGAGHDAIPVAKYGVSLGFKAIIVDPRLAYNSEERFPGAMRVLAETDQFAKNLHIDRRTYIVVMNHHLERDQETLKFVLPSQAPYIGVLGPLSRRIRMMNAIEKEGIVFRNHQLKRMYSPIGLDIGAVTSEEIAVSILAEIVAVKNGHTGGFLQNSEHIHQAAKF
ncbi:XdhC family protein [Bacillus sp. B190/17]|uniref:XdhC family protein n=1 Tax=Bacillus lumedeiriae TaxID=3058829 RepID=A0ABW8I966_9BACI